MTTTHICRDLTAWRLRTASVAIIAGLTVAGCPMQPDSAALGPLVRTSIPEGIYTGNYFAEAVSTVNGAVVDQQSLTTPASEIVDSNGLPLIQPDGVPPRQNQTTTYRFGDVNATVTITSVNAAGNRLVINFQAVMVANDVELSGYGTWIYEFVSPNTLDFEEVIDAASTSVNGRILTMHYVGSATLTK